MSAPALPPALLDRLGEGYWVAWDAQGGTGSGFRWADLPEEGRRRFRALAAEMVRRAGVAEALAQVAGTETGMAEA